MSSVKLWGQSEALWIKAQQAVNNSIALCRVIWRLTAKGAVAQSIERTIVQARWNLLLCPWSKTKQLAQMWGPLICRALRSFLTLLVRFTERIGTLRTRPTCRELGYRRWTLQWLLLTKEQPISNKSIFLTTQLPYLSVKACSQRSGGQLRSPACTIDEAQNWQGCLICNWSRVNNETI